MNRYFSLPRLNIFTFQFMTSVDTCAAMRAYTPAEAPAR